MEKTLDSKRHEVLIGLLVEQRKRIGLTQLDLATLLSEHQSFVARLETGQRRVDTVEFLHLCELLDLKPEKVIRTLIAIPK